MRRPTTARVAAALLAAALVLPTGPAVAGSQPPSPSRGGAPAEVLASATDPSGDVRLTRARGLTATERRSIDLRGLTISERGRHVRFELDVRRVTRAPRFRQVYLITLRAPGYVATQIIVISRTDGRPRDRHGVEHRVVTEGTGTPQGYVQCDHLPLRFRGGAARWWVDVPRRCLPQGGALVDVSSQTAKEYRQTSSDRLRLPRRVDVGGTIPPES